MSSSWRKKQSVYIMIGELSIRMFKEKNSESLKAFRGKLLNHIVSMGISIWEQIKSPIEACVFDESFEPHNKSQIIEYIFDKNSPKKSIELTVLKGIVQRFGFRTKKFESRLNKIPGVFVVFGLVISTCVFYKE